MAMIYANIIGSDPAPKSPRSAAWPRCCGCMYWQGRTSSLPGLLFSRGAGDDAANPVRHLGRAGAAAVRFVLTGETVMSSIKIFHNPAWHVAQHVGADPQQRR